MILIYSKVQLLFTKPGIFTITPDSELAVTLAVTDGTLIFTTGTLFPIYWIDVSFALYPMYLYDNLQDT